MKQLKIPLLLGTLMLFAIVSCKVAFVPKSSAQAIANVHQLQLDIVSLYDGYADAVDKKFDEGKYADVTSDIDNMVAYEGTRDKAKDIIRQAVLVQQAFVKFKSEHKAKSEMNGLRFKIYKKYLLDQLKPLEISELSLK